MNVEETFRSRDEEYCEYLRVEEDRLLSVRYDVKLSVILSVLQK